LTEAKFLDESRGKQSNPGIRTKYEIYITDIYPGLYCKLSNMPSKKNTDINVIYRGHHAGVLLATTEATG
jgi:hypothetical protein